MRNILDNSKYQFVSLSKEIHTLRLYLELESARLENSFDYLIKIDTEIDPDLIKIPPMLVQPFVENSIWHGISSKKNGGYVCIEIKLLSNGFLEILITDNGIGRNKSWENKKHQNKQHKSYGIDITMERLKLFNDENQMEVVDLYDQDNAVAGTKVVLILKTEKNEDNYN